ncbi:Hsp70/Hsp90 co-chaperone CNS1 [Cercospora beticola]|uniref:Hsp70/Hsp90 co-chaperone CNS1 n=1 Tax=Cercospora beticola TaxID=122368 RepID=A0A2G5HT96_CERBT|nr:Hsp70/Hsp90 co-chaperone CNS1 [Cercospora beticola]PIA95746.1 Hsp70/Hsp90 co-chaperone CNS1 [Cercospora beticola]WPB07477.1 hypothetical protein RHO25_012138 [Cercospora beticola]CAK1367475.1 unnamed protein product [Cercospora beticola]
MAQNSNRSNPTAAVTAQPPASNNGEAAAEAQNQQTHQDAADSFVDNITAAMPPSMEEKRTKTADELLAEMNRVPLFMTTLDETDGEGGENVMLEAIKALAYEGTKAEVATNFREQGNETARAKNWKDAREFYSKAIASVQGKVKLVEAPEKDDDPAIPSTSSASTPRIIDVTELDDAAKKGTEELDEEAEKAKEREIEEACLANRALCNLELKNYGQCIKDCASALRLNPKNIKALYRAASACLALDKLPEALDATTKGLNLDPSNTPLITLNKKITTRQEYLSRLETERLAREEKQRKESLTLSTALKARNIVLRDKAGEGSNAPPEMEDAAIHLSSPLNPSSTLTFPVLFLYPLAAQTDFVKAFQETETLLQHLEYLLPVPWEEETNKSSTSTTAEKEYGTPEAVECYMETSSGGLIKAGKKLVLGKLLGSGKIVIVDGLVRVFVVPKKRAGEWIEKFKERRGRS